MTKPEQAGLRPKVWKIIHKVIRDPFYDSSMGALDEMLALFEATCLEVISLPKAQQRQTLSKLLGRGEEG